MGSLQRLRTCFQPRQWFVGDGEVDPSVVDEKDTFMWVYRKGSDGRYKFEVGYFLPDGSWFPEGGYETRDDAAARVNYLNGGQHG